MLFLIYNESNNRCCINKRYLDLFFNIASCRYKMAGSRPQAEYLNNDQCKLKLHMYQI